MRSSGVNPTVKPWRTPANAIAQNKAAPIPQIIPTAVELKRLAESKRALRSPLVPE
jgi:hypothetical protein